MTSTLLTFGTFDCVHAGHSVFLRRCERFADQVVVGLRSDAMVEQLKGSRPVFSYAEREALITALGYQIYESDEIAWDLIEHLRPDVLAVGSDWARGDAGTSGQPQTRSRSGVLDRYGIDQDFLDARQITLVYVPYTPNISTTILKERLGR